VDSDDHVRADDAVSDTRSPGAEAGNLNLTSYSFYNSTLRAWFIAFGVGFPALVLSQQHLFNKVAESRWPSLLLLFGVGLQIVGAILNKYVNWACYWRAQSGDPDDKFKLKHPVLSWLTDISPRMGIDFTIDLLSLAAFATGAVWAAFSLTS
jgi:hypothetical protein